MIGGSGIFSSCEIDIICIIYIPSLLRSTGSLFNSTHFYLVVHTLGVQCAVAAVVQQG